MQNGPNGNVELQPKFISAEMAGMIEAAESRAYARGVAGAARVADNTPPEYPRSANDVGSEIADRIRALTKGT